MSSILRRNGGALLIVLGGALACSTGETTDRPAASTARACATPADSIVGLATVAFTKYITPKPHRYLIPVGTDSALPAPTGRSR